MNPSALPLANQPIQVTPTPQPQTSLQVTGSPYMPSAEPAADLSQSGNFFVRNLPAIGGIVGGVAGLPLQSVNAVAPGLGVAANIATAGAGQAYGEALKQRLQGRQLSPSEIAKQYAIGGAQQAVGEGLGFVAKPITGRIGSALTGLSEKAIAGQLPKGALRAGTAQELQKMGVYGTEQIAKIAPEITGAEGAIPVFVKNALADSGQKVDITPLYNSLESLMMDNQDQFATNTAKVLRGHLNRSIAQATTGRGVTEVGTTQVIEPSILRKVDPEAAWNLMKGFEARAEKAVASGAFSTTSPQPLQRALYNVNKGMAAEVERALFKDMPLTPEMKVSLINSFANLKRVNPTAYNYYVNEVTNANLLSDLRRIQAPLVDASTAIQQGIELDQKGSGLTGKQIIRRGAEIAAPIAALTSGNIPLSIASALPLAADTELGSQMLSKGLYKTGANLQQGLASKVLPTLARMTGVGLAKAPGVLTSLEQGAPQMDTSMGGAAPAAGVPLGTLGVGGAASPALTTGMGAGMGAGTQAVSPSRLADILTLGYANPSFLTALGLTADQRTKLAKVDQAQAALSSLESSFKGAKGAKGGAVGRFEILASKLKPGTVSAFRNQRGVVANQIAEATGLDRNLVLQSMPDVTDTTKGANAKIEQLRGLITSAGQGAQVTGLGATGLGGLLSTLAGGGGMQPSQLPDVTGLSQ